MPPPGGQNSRGWLGWKGLRKFCTKSKVWAFANGSMSLNNNNPVNNEGQGSSNGSGDWAEDKGKDKGKDKGLGSPSATYKRSDQVKDRKTDR